LANQEPTSQGVLGVSQKSTERIHGSRADRRDDDPYDPDGGCGADCPGYDPAQQERELRHALWEMRDGIDRYKDAADRAAFQVKVDSQGYPPDLETLVKGVDSNCKKMRFLRRIPIDPMTGKTEWGLRSLQDDPESDSWGGQSVFDVYTKSEGT